ncbi:single-stranded DNA-binding protein [Terrimonas ferruginea]|nr:single-stranded DNA-binding protein [Terrimonas ferruginea]
MKSLNKAQLIGWLGKDPEILKRRDGSTTAKLNLATDTVL